MHYALSCCYCCCCIIYLLLVSLSLISAARALCLATLIDCRPACRSTSFLAANHYRPVGHFTNHLPYTPGHSRTQIVINWNCWMRSAVAAPTIKHQKLQHHQQQSSCLALLQQCCTQNVMRILLTLTNARKWRRL